MDQPFIAFVGKRRLVAGALHTVAVAVRSRMEAGESEPLAIFDNATGRTVDLDLSGRIEDVAQRYEIAAGQTSGAAPARTVGRPRLGVVSKEVSLLQRHWEWLARQPQGASASLRRLVEGAIKTDAGRTELLERRAAADRFMAAMLGDEAGYEDASRALYAADRESFMARTRHWPADLREHLLRMAEVTFEHRSEGGPLGRPGA